MESTYLEQFLDYCCDKELIDFEDRIYTENRICNLLGISDGSVLKPQKKALTIQEILDGLMEVAIKNNLLTDTIVNRDLFDTAIMGQVCDRPSIVTGKFFSLYKDSPKAATQWFYTYCQDINYIRSERIKKDRRWIVSSDYGEIDITINLSKPEKDPRDIAAAKTLKQSGYPKCQLCPENVGYAGRLDHPARQNLRVIPLDIDGNPWSFQYSPYVYYNEHCILLNNNHIPMAINEGSFRRLFSFIDQFPHYFIGSNADLPIVGGSILTHDHFQGGHYEFAMERASIIESFSIDGFPEVKVGMVNWPLSVLRLNSPQKEPLIKLASKILDAWIDYSDEDVDLISHSNGERHNTITPIARMKNGNYELDLALRNNRTTDEYPLGIFHPHSQYHHIKKENIGLIEVMGLAVLPARLNREMDILKDCILSNRPLEEEEALSSHLEWAKEFIPRYKFTDEESIDFAIKEEIGKVFVKVLEDAGVFKCTDEGRAAFRRFINSLSPNA